MHETIFLIKFGRFMLFRNEEKYINKALTIINIMYTNTPFQGDGSCRPTDCGAYQNKSAKLRAIKKLVIPNVSNTHLVKLGLTLLGEDTQGKKEISDSKINTPPIA